MLNINLNKKNKVSSFYSIEFRYSYLLLTTSLDNLSKTFALNKGKLEKKLPFPYKFVNESWVDYNYKGPFPNIKYYDNINDGVYQKFYSNKVWCLKAQTITYCEQDCKTLYYSIKEFSKEIFKEFRVDITCTPTISSLAFRIFRSNFLGEKNNIAVLNGHVYDFIYQGYYGGAVDAYIPAGENIKGYDVNSLYPTSMKNNPMPVGNPYYFEGNILEHFYKLNYNYPTDSDLNGSIKNKIKPKTIFDFLNKNF